MTYTFIITHFGAGSTMLCRLLDMNSNICCLGTTGLVYDSPVKLGELRRLWKKQSSRTMPEHCIDRLFYNHQLSSKSFFDFCNFIYLVREPTHALSAAMEQGFAPEAAADYYAFRLRRMCEMAVKTRNGVLISYDQLVDEQKRPRKFKQIEEMLNLRSPFTPYFKPLQGDRMSLQEGRIIKWAEELDEQAPLRIIDHSKVVYQRYLKFLAAQPNLRY
jgi:hypothetical protein